MPPEAPASKAGNRGKTVNPLRPHLNGVPLVAMFDGACRTPRAAASSAPESNRIAGAAVMAFEDILYEKRDGIATITINRPEVLNAFRAETVEEMLQAMRDAEEDRDIGVIVLAGAGDRAFCAGGDNSARGSPEGGGYGGGGVVGAPAAELDSAPPNSRQP